MPSYSFQDKKGKIEYFIFASKDVPSIGKTVKIKNKNWTRVIIEAPKAQVDSISKIDINNPKDFVDKTARKSGTLGDLWTESQNLSDQRIEKEGRDVIKEKYAEDHKKRRKGRNTLKKDSIPF